MVYLVISSLLFWFILYNVSVLLTKDKIRKFSTIYIDNVLNRGEVKSGFIFDILNKTNEIEYIVKFTPINLFLSYRIKYKDAPYYEGVLRWSKLHYQIKKKFNEKT